MDPVYAPLRLQPHLRQIRLIDLQPGPWDAPIDCQLRVAALGEDPPPQFEALSYVWGSGSAIDSSSETIIILNGHRVPVSASLVSALRHVRSTVRPRVLWADAICIHQRDIPERNEQVALMQDIYLQCARVLVWLGDVAGGEEVQADAPEDRCVWRIDASNDVVYEDRMRTTAYENALKTHYGLPLALRFRQPVSFALGAFCLVHELALHTHITQRAIPLFAPATSSSSGRRSVVQALHDEIMGAAWWDRQWVVQELVLPREVVLHCGRHAAPWGMFARAARTYDLHRRLPCCASHHAEMPRDERAHLEEFARKVNELEEIRRTWREHGHTGETSLLGLLWKFRNRKSSDERDKVFGLLSLVRSWGKESPIRAQYDWTPERTYHAVVEKLIAVEGSLRVLIGHTEKNELQNLPTWVPDWTFSPQKYELERLGRMPFYDASKGMRPDPRFVGDRFLGLQGVLCGEVTAIEDIMQFSDSEKCHRTFQNWYERAMKDSTLHGRYKTEDARMDAYWRTLCMDTVQHMDHSHTSLQAEGEGNMSFRERAYKRAPADYVDRCRAQWMGEHSDTTVDEAPYDAGYNRVTVDYAIVSATMGRRLFITSTGYVGLGPSMTAVGDTIYVLIGGCTPFVLRSAEERDVLSIGHRECHQLIGDCYVHGLMDGEAMEHHKDTQQEIYLL